ncbi:MAG TPA: SGNH/GDSL hydrolase family protein [Pyrinomonadaceae bacterium]|nr:SGNH/GDSL hydrolase family protein [Pyrinomonadaceae bacterium]
MNTSEFSSIVHTNSMGFRDREFTTQKSAQTRIVAIGDSFTFGWGVQDAESWPKVLENRLRESGLNVELANLGKPGGSPANYAEIAENALPLLHPDLVIVGVLQGDDVAQMGIPSRESKDENADYADVKSTHRALHRLMKLLYPNLLRIVDHSHVGSSQLTPDWTALAQTSLAAFTPAEKKRFDELDADVKKAFFAGELNPSLVYLAIRIPDYFMETMNLDSDVTRNHISQTAEQLKRIKAAADRNDTRVIVVSVPYGIYVSAASWATRKRIAFNTTPEMLSSSNPDDAIKQASQLAGIDFCEVTKQFRKASINQQLFFELDGHFNRKGHALFAESVAPVIRDLLPN